MTQLWNKIFYMSYEKYEYVLLHETNQNAITQM